jgi:hypothetical protein
MRLVALLALSMSLPAVAQPASPKPAPPPSDAECAALPAAKLPLSFSSGELLDFDIDALGAQAGKMTMRVLPGRDGALPVEVHAQTNTFFSKVRRVTGTATSFLHPRTLKPHRYVEDATENEVHKLTEVSFKARERVVRVDYRIGARNGSRQFPLTNDALDVAGAIYFLRQIPLKQDTRVCFDVYGIRAMWRMVGKVEQREHVSLPVGEFDAWHLSGTAIRLDDHRQRREVHVWISDDARRLPIVALGSLDLGTVRATLTGYLRPGEKKAKAEGKESMKW